MAEQSVVRNLKLKQTARMWSLGSLSSRGESRINNEVVVIE